MTASATLPLVTVAPSPGARARRLALGATLLCLPLVLDTYWAFVLGIAASFAIVTLGLRVLVGDAGQVSLGHGALMAVGAFTSANLSARLGLPTWAGFPAAAAAGALAGLVVGLPALRLRGLHLAVTTLAFALAADRFLFRLETVSGSSGGLPVPPLRVGGTTLDAKGACVVALALALVTYAITRDLRGTRLGLALRLTRSGDAVAANVGVSPAAGKLAAFVLSGAIAGVGGAMLGVFLGQVSAWTFGGTRSIQLVMLTLIGGSASAGGVAAVTALFTALPEISRGLGDWLTVASGLLLLVTLIRVPEGLGGLISGAWTTIIAGGSRR